MTVLLPNTLWGTVLYRCLPSGGALVLRVLMLGFYGDGTDFVLQPVVEIWP